MRRVSLRRISLRRGTMARRGILQMTEIARDRGIASAMRRGSAMTLRRRITLRRISLRRITVRRSAAVLWGGRAVSLWRRGTTVAVLWGRSCKVNRN